MVVVKPDAGKLYRCLRLRAADVKTGDFLFSEDGDKCQAVKKVVVDTENRPMARIYVTDDPIFLWLDSLVTVLQPIRVAQTPQEESDEKRKQSPENHDRQ